MKTKGELLFEDGKAFFRVYTKDGQFKDYEFSANDVTIEIADPFVRMVDVDEEGGYIDYTDEVLGIKK